jgi:hypothetical protein
MYHTALGTLGGCPHHKRGFWTAYHATHWPFMQGGVWLCAVAFPAPTPVAITPACHPPSSGMQGCGTTNAAHNT